MKSSAGYSLFEVLIAFSVMSITLAILLPSQARWMQKTNSSEATLMAFDYAISVANELSLGASPEKQNTTFKAHGWRIETRVENIGSTSPEIFVLVRDASGEKLAQFIRPTPFQ